MKSHRAVVLLNLCVALIVANIVFVAGVDKTQPTVKSVQFPPNVTHATNATNVKNGLNTRIDTASIFCVLAVASFASATTVAFVAAMTHVLLEFKKGKGWEMKFSRR